MTLVAGVRFSRSFSISVLVISRFGEAQGWDQQDGWVFPLRSPHILLRASGQPSTIFLLITLLRAPPSVFRAHVATLSPVKGLKWYILHLRTTCCAGVGFTYGTWGRQPSQALRQADLFGTRPKIARDLRRAKKTDNGHLRRLHAPPGVQKCRVMA